MQIEFLYFYIWNSENRSYHVTYNNGECVVRSFAEGIVGTIVNPVPNTRMIEIQARIDELVATATSFYIEEANA